MAKIKIVYNPLSKEEQDKFDKSQQEFYEKYIKASEDTGVHHSSICQCFTGKKKSARGFIWKKEL